MAIRFALLALCISIGNWATAHAEDKPAPDLKALREQVDKLLVKHYPKATIKAGLEEQTIDFQYQTRKFMIHEPLLTGEWQDA